MHTKWIRLLQKLNYRKKHAAELTELKDSEMWQAGKTVKSLRPENQK
jgi:ketol-acid reductoisomerase